MDEAVSRYSYRIPEQENLWEAYQVVIRRLLTLVDRPFKMNKLGVAEDDDRQFEVVREAWVNMLMHADHFSPFRSAIHVFTDRIEFMNCRFIPYTSGEDVRHAVFFGKESDDREVVPVCKIVGKYRFRDK